MSLPTFIGTYQQNLWQNASINPSTNSPPPNRQNGFYPYQTFGSIVNYNPFNKNISWQTTGISVNTVNDLVQLLQGTNNSYTIQCDFNYSLISGLQETACNGKPLINLVIFPIGGASVLSFTNIGAAKFPITGTSNYCDPTCPPAFFYSTGPLTSGFSPYEIQVNPWNDNIGCDNYTVTSFTLQVTMNVTVIINCSTGLGQEKL